MKNPPKPRAPFEMPKLSVRAVSWFVAYGRFYVRRRFHSMRVLKTGLPPALRGRPVVIFLNHPSWWDPLVCLLLSREFFPDRESFGPIDAAMLKRYRFFKHLGFYGIELNSAAGAKQFLNVSRVLLTSARNAIWLTPQGRFMDSRERPLRLQNGIGTLAATTENTVFIPMAVEYAFWTEPRPEILLSFGEPIMSDPESARTSTEWTNLLENALEITQNNLAGSSFRRDPNEWRVLNSGSSGVSIFYDAWRWMRSRFRGEKFTPEHQPQEMK